MDEFKDSTTSLVADVDCTAEGKDLCEKNDVRGYPSIKWGDPNDLKDYDGGRSFADLKKFAEENLGPTCGPDNLDLCDDEKKAMIEKFQAMDEDTLNKAIEEAQGKLDKITAKSQKTIDGLQEKIAGYQKDVEAATKKKEDAVAKETKKTGLTVMKKVVSAAKKKEDGKDGKGKRRKKGKTDL